MAVTHRDALDSPASRPKATPLPLYQLLIVYLIQIAEPISATVIYPFVNQLVRGTGIINGDERKTGYYAGIIGSAFFFAEAITVYYWGAASDRYGRRPILLFGPIGLCLAMLSFGLSDTYLMLVVSRCIQGVFNGNIGVAKSVIAEITDETNMADAYAFIPVVYGVGSALGPVIGGILAEPASRWPRLFASSGIWGTHPYLLPCTVAAAIALLSGAVASLSLKESSPYAIARQKEKWRREFDAGNPCPGSTSPLLNEPAKGYGSRQDIEDRDQILVTSTTGKKDSPRFRDLLIPQVLLPVVAIMFLAFIEMSCQVLLPLMYSTSISLGGLGFDAYTIGIIMSVWGAVNSVVLVMAFGPVIRRFGPRTVHLFSYVAYLAYIALYPLLSYFVRKHGGVNAQAWTIIVIQLACRLTSYMSYGAIQIIIVNSAPSKDYLGATNGLAQAMSSATSALGPSVASSLFSISLERQVLGGNMVYVALSGVALAGMALAFMLPKEIRTRA